MLVVASLLVASTENSTAQHDPHPAVRAGTVVWVHGPRLLHTCMYLYMELQCPAIKIISKSRGAANPRQGDRTQYRDSPYTGTV